MLTPAMAQEVWKSPGRLKFFIAVSLPSEARVLRLGTPVTDREGMHAWT